MTSEERLTETLILCLDYLQLEEEAFRDKYGGYYSPEEIVTELKMRMATAKGELRANAKKQESMFRWILSQQMKRLLLDVPMGTIEDIRNQILRAFWNGR